MTRDLFAPLEALKNERAYFRPHQEYSRGLLGVINRCNAHVSQKVGLSKFKGQQGYLTQIKTTLLFYSFSSSGKIK